MKTILVTGGNRGIGFEICKQLDQHGHMIILGSRDFDKGYEAARSLSKNVIVKQLDVTSEESIVNLFEFIYTDFGKLDVLINNAGIGERSLSNENPLLIHIKNIMEKEPSGLSHIKNEIHPEEDKQGLGSTRHTASNVSLLHVKHIVETNLYGPWRMIQAFIPLLLKSENGRIINMSSGLGELRSLSGVYPGYSLSKATLNAMTIMFANELRDKGITVNAMSPGWVKTDMGGPNAPQPVSSGADTAVWLTTENNIPTGKMFLDRHEINW